CARHGKHYAMDYW
nr:immunoglobulin heavy chain junction region [Mus musculus]MBK4196357.1 immunoglobulin heavy chain junction region [Mus musculus]MBK4196358.1 immunoglobulin heavy chain junction region [Mus musculus]MBK4196359.1 immunoglobulin heavy chain junction region [Mus musculus]MBK4196360.1 immunoglobulin heavy chain junction region [Mus musculus]